MSLLNIFSSPEPKTQVSFSDPHLSVVRRRRCRHKIFTFSSSFPEPLGQLQPNLVRSILGKGEASNKTLLLQSHSSNFNQTWYKASLGKGESSLFKWRARRFPREYNYEIANIHWRNLKIFFSRTARLVYTKNGTSRLGWRGFKFVLIKNHSIRIK